MHAHHSRGAMSWLAGGGLSSSKSCSKLFVGVCALTWAAHRPPLQTTRHVIDVVHHMEGNRTGIITNLMVHQQRVMDDYRAVMAKLMRVSGEGWLAD